MPNTWEEVRYASHLQNEALISANFEGACNGEAKAGHIVHQAMVRQAQLHGINADNILPVPDNPFDGIDEMERLRLIAEHILKGGPETVQYFIDALAGGGTLGPRVIVDGETFESD